MQFFLTLNESAPTDERQDKKKKKKMMKYCPICGAYREVDHVIKPDVELKLCRTCGSAVSVLYKDS